LRLPVCLPCVGLWYTAKAQRPGQRPAIGNAQGIERKYRRLPEGAEELER
jgi:hypothetical protein